MYDTSRLRRSIVGYRTRAEFDTVPRKANQIDTIATFDTILRFSTLSYVDVFAQDDISKTDTRTRTYARAWRAKRVRYYEYVYIVSSMFRIESFDTLSNNTGMAYTFTWRVLVPAYHFLGRPDR